MPKEVIGYHEVTIRNRKINRLTGQFELVERIGYEPIYREIEYGEPDTIDSEVSLEDIPIIEPYSWKHDKNMRNWGSNGRVQEHNDLDG